MLVCRLESKGGDEMKALKVLVGVTCVIVSVSGILYIKEKFDDKRRMMEIIRKGPVDSEVEWVEPKTSPAEDDEKVITVEFDPRYD